MKTQSAILVIGLLLSLVLPAQNKIQVQLHFEIEEATINGEDLTGLFTSNEAFIVIFKNLADSSRSMSICWRANKSQSFGVLREHKVVIFNEPFDGEIAKRTNYKWFYNNSFDSIRGVANFELIEITKPAGVYYILKMVTDKFDLCTYKGYLVEKSIGEVTQDK